MLQLGSESVTCFASWIFDSRDYGDYHLVSTCLHTASARCQIQSAPQYDSLMYVFIHWLVCKVTHFFSLRQIFPFFFWYFGKNAVVQSPVMIAGLWMAVCLWLWAWFQRNKQANATLFDGMCVEWHCGVVGLTSLNVFCDPKNGRLFIENLAAKSLKSFWNDKKYSFGGWKRCFFGAKGMF